MAEDKELDRWNQIIYALNGTCESLGSLLCREEAEDLRDHMPFLNYLDGEIFCCETCGWWHEISESSEADDTSCRDCVPNEE